MLLLLVAHAEKRRLKNVDAAIGYKGTVEAHEERRKEHPDVKPVDIGIGRENDFRISQMIERVFNVERFDEIEEFLVLVKNILVEPARVERLTLKEEYGLVHRVARKTERSARGLSFGQKDHRVIAFGTAGLLVDLIELKMILAVLELRNADRNRLGAFARLLLDGVELRADLAGLLDLGDELIGFGRRTVERGENFLAHLGDEIGADIVHHELDLRLAFENGIHDSERHRSDKAVADIVALEFLFRPVIVERLRERLLERGKMGAAVGRVLAVDERMILFAETVGMGEDYFEILRLDVKRRIEFFELGLVGYKIGEPPFGTDRLTVEIDRKTGVHVAVHPHASYDMLLAHLEILENLHIRLVADERSVRLARFALAAFFRF